jgi:hypothetical protein
MFLISMLTMAAIFAPKEISGFFAFIGVYRRSSAVKKESQNQFHLTATILSITY